MTMSATETTDPLEELQHENEITQGLLERVLEQAEILKGGKDVSPGEVYEGLRLFEQYRQFHVTRMDSDLQTEARPVAMQTCFQHLDQLPKDHAEISEALEDAKLELGRYESGAAGSRASLAVALERLANRTFAVRTHEGDYPLCCLVTALPEDASQRLAERFSTTRTAVEDLEGHIRRLLATPAGEQGSPLSVRCAHEGCAAKSKARVVPVHEGRLGLMAPSGGWGVTPRTAKLGSDGVARIRVDFLCPEHAKTQEGSAPAPLALAVWADDGGRTGRFPGSMLARTPTLKGAPRDTWERASSSGDVGVLQPHLQGAM